MVYWFYVTAMTGDGVNDAPASNVRIFINHGSLTQEAAKNAGVVLADDNFATLRDAVVKGAPSMRICTKPWGLSAADNGCPSADGRW